MNFFIHDPITGEAYSRDPRNIARKAMAYLASTGIGDTAYFAPEAEFYVFDNVRFETKQNAGFYEIDSVAGAWNTGRVERTTTAATRSSTRAATSPSRRTDHFGDLRDEMVDRAREVRPASSSAPTTRSAPPARPRSTTASTSCSPAADDVMKFKYIVKNVALAQRQDRDLHAEADLRRQRLGHARATSRSGTTASRCSTTRPATRGLSDMARWYIGGLLKHAPSLLAFTNPTVNSYHRLVPGFEAPISLVYSQRNRSACVRIPITGSNPKAKRIEFRCPDPSANPYLAFSALLLAGLDGIQNKIEPPAPDRQGHLRAAAGRDGRDRPGADLARRGARQPRGATTTSCSRATSSPPT